MFRISLAPYVLLVSILVEKAQASDGLEPGSRFPYLFSVPGNVAFASVFFLLALAHFYLTIRSGKKWPLCLPIAEVFSALGYVLRIVCRSNQQSIPLYAAANLFVVLAPAAFLAFNYMMYGRLIIALDNDITPASKRTTRSRFSLLPPRIFGPLFVWSDVVTFLIQATGGGLQASGNNANLGDKIFLVGVTLQAISYIIFTILVIYSHICIGLSYKVPKLSIVLVALYLASICVLIRSFFRVVEMAGGYDGKLYRTEIYLFLLDALPLALCNLIWVVVWPPKYIDLIIASSSLPLTKASSPTALQKV